jgi:hypothetical protein
MLVISNEKNKALEKEIRQPDKAELQTDLAKIFPTLPTDELDRFIEIGLEKAAKYGIDEQFAVKDFIRLMIIIAQDFDEHPKVKQQLTRRDANPNLRVQLARELLTPDEWREAANHGPKADLGSQKYYV